MPGGNADGGPRVARVFHTLLALVSLTAWFSLGTQLLLLVGEHGLLPMAELFARAKAQGVGPSELPTLLWLAHSDGALLFGVLLGTLVSLLALLGFQTRLAFAVNAALYLSYTVGCDTFTSFQWDNMLVEASLLAALLPRDRPAPYAALLLRLLWFKLYLESGIAKWQSDLGDWKDGSAMSFYYETAPLPTWLAWYAHQLPAYVHRLESWAALFMELVVPFFAFGPRALRLFAFVYVSGFLVIDTATANYGFFTYLAAALQVCLLRDSDIAWLQRQISARLPTWLKSGAPREAEAPIAPPPSAAWPRRAALALFFAAWTLASINGALIHFTRRAATHETLLHSYQTLEPFRLANVYHLFGQITRERVEPEFQTAEGETWTAHAMRYKPGPPQRPPPIVAPHQPRVDFRLWFYGLAYEHGMPRFVHTLLDRLCHAPRVVQPLFSSRLPEHPEAVRIVFHRYRFTTPHQRRRTAAYWTREELGATQPLRCDSLVQQ